MAIEPVGAGYTINGQCGVAQGAAMAEILDRFCDTEFHADWERARNRLGDGVTPSDLERTAAQRRMDALHAIFMAAAAAAPGSKPPEPLVTIVVDQTTFESAVTAMAAGVPLDEVMPPVVDPHGDAARRSTAPSSTPTTPSSPPSSATSAASCSTAPRAPSTSAPPVDCSAAPHASPCGSRAPDVCGPDAGATTVRSTTTCRGATTGGPPTNGGPACAHHNRWKTRGYHTRRDANGHWHIHRPDGSEIQPI